jgi:transposase
VDALGNPVRLSVTEGQVHDITQAAELLGSVHQANVIADKGYDSDALIAVLAERDCAAVIPPRDCRAGRRREYDKHVYKERFLVECFFQKIKRNRRLSMRFEKLAAHFLGMLTLASALIWAL